MISTKTTSDIARTTLSVLFIGILIAASFWILRPFLMALVWATMIVVTTWPLMLSIEKALWGKRALAVVLMTVALLLLLIIPLAFGIVSIVERSDDIVGWLKALPMYVLRPPPVWIEQLPVVGAKLAERWRNLAMVDPVELSARLAPHARTIVSWVAAQTGSVMMMVVQFLLTVIISAVLYSTGEKAAKGVCLFARRLGGQNGEDAAILAAKAIRGVALGVVVTALVQSLLGGIGLIISGVPAAAILTAVMFVLCVAQVGPALVLIPATVWLFWQDHAGWGTFMIVCTIVVGVIDNFIRPFLIKKGADLPLLLIFSGVIGGLIAFGVIGLFIGPVMLAVTYKLLEAWVIKDDPALNPAGDEGALV